MAIFSAFEAFDYRTFSPFGGLPSATTVTPDPLHPDMQYVANLPGTFSLLVQGDGFTYGNNNTPQSGIIKEAALYQTIADASDVPTSLLFTVDKVSITAQKALQYFFMKPVDVIKDVLKGNDVVNGSTEKDDIAGFAGRDYLTGKGGMDTFHFTEKPTGKNFDIVSDFDKSGSDTIALDDAIFKGVTKANIGSTFKDITNLSIAEGNNSLDDNDHILYSQKTGCLYYDADGNGKDGADPILVAVLQAGSSKLHPHLTSGDFLIE